MLKQGHVAIFWDLGKCYVHSSVPGHRIVDKILKLSQPFGCVRSFQGYAELTTLGATNTLRWRSELQASGVCLIDCPAMDCRSISSKTMIVDMLLYAADNPRPATFIIIAGDDDFAYAISSLRLRRYEVVLVCPKSPGAQHTLASTYVDWQDVFGTDLALIRNLEPESGITGALSSSVDVTEAPAAVTDEGNVSLATAHVRDHDSVLHTDSPGSSDERDPSESLSSQTETFRERYKETPCSPSIDHATAPIILQLQHEEEPERHLSDMASGGAPLAPPSHSSLSLAPTPTSEGLHPSSHCGPSGLPWYAGRQSTDKGTSHEPSRFPQPQSEAPSAVKAPAAATTPGSPISITGHLSPELEIKSSLSSSAYATPEWKKGRPLPTNSGYALPSTSPLLSEISSDTVLPLYPEPSTPRVQPPSVLPRPSLASESSATARCPVSPQTRPPEPPVVPAHFAPLVTILQAYRARGNLKPFRPGLAAEVVSLHKNHMRTVDASTFMQYAQAAERAGIVELSRPYEGCWIALRPEFYDYHYTE